MISPALRRPLSDHVGQHGAGTLAIGASYHRDEQATIEAVVPHVDVFEVTPDSLVFAAGDAGKSTLDAAAVDELRALWPAISVVAHGVGLSIASHDRWSDFYLRGLDQLVDALPLAWHSEHLGYTHVNGEYLGTMLPAPRTAEMLELLASRISRIQERYGLPFLVENVVGLLPDYPGTYSDAEFLNRLVDATGCGLLLDVYNLRCEEANRGLALESFLDEVRLDAVIELHVAGGVRHKGFTLDVHSRAPRAATLDLAAEVASRCPNLRLVTYELLDEAVGPLGTANIVSSLVATREAVFGESATRGTSGRAGDRSVDAK